MARAGLRWSVRDLAALARVSAATVIRFENGQVTPIAATLEAIRRAFENGGAEFRGGDGVRVPARPSEMPAAGAPEGPGVASPVYPAGPTRTLDPKPTRAFAEPVGAPDKPQTKAVYARARPSEE